MGSACKLDDIIFWGTSPLNSCEEEVRARISPDEFAEKKFNHTGSAPRRNKFHDMKAHLYYKKKWYGSDTNGAGAKTVLLRLDKSRDNHRDF